MTTERLTNTPADVERFFTYHAPTAEQRQAYERIRESAKALALELVADGSFSGVDRLADAIVDLCPEGTERRLALEALEEAEDSGTEGLDDFDQHEALTQIRAAVMWANAAIACAPTEGEVKA